MQQKSFIHKDTTFKNCSNLFPPFTVIAVCSLICLNTLVEADIANKMHPDQTGFIVFALDINILSAFDYMYMQTK